MQKSSSKKFSIKSGSTKKNLSTDGFMVDIRPVVKEKKTKLNIEENQE